MALGFGARILTVAEPRAPLPSATGTSGGTTKLPARVLLVEDVAATQRLYALYLKRAGAETDTADNGRIAVERVTESMRDARPYDLVLMDMQMPVLDGYSAAKELRELGYRGPIIAVTAHALAGDRDKCLAAGCDDYIAKPTDREHLVKTCLAWLAKSIPPALPSSAESESRAELA